jgi:hypothetical protein
MGIGVGIFLLALGAVLAFAVDWTLAGLNLHAVGWILMAAGAIGLVLFFYFWNRRRVPAGAARQPQIRAESRRYYEATPTAPTTPVVPVAVPAPVVVTAPAPPPARIVASAAAPPSAAVVTSAPVAVPAPDRRAD